MECPQALAFDATNHHRGLSNGPGENNCFLNATIQALWHLGPFRVELLRRSSTGAKQGEGDAVFEKLSNLFTQYQFADQSGSALNAQDLRIFLSQLSSEFQLGSIADANEVLDYILQKVRTSADATSATVRVL